MGPVLCAVRRATFQPAFSVVENMLSVFNSTYVQLKVGVPMPLNQP